MWILDHESFLMGVFIISFFIRLIIRHSPVTFPEPPQDRDLRAPALKYLDIVDANHIFRIFHFGGRPGWVCQK